MDFRVLKDQIIKITLNGFAVIGFVGVLTQGMKFFNVAYLAVGLLSISVEILEVVSSKKLQASFVSLVAFLVLASLYYVACFTGLTNFDPVKLLYLYLVAIIIGFPLSAFQKNLPIDF